MAATYSKPTTIPRWADTSGNVVEPSSGKKDAGWLVDETGISSWENWRAKLLGNWIKWLDERFADGSTKDFFVINHPGSGSKRLEFDTDSLTFFSGTGRGTNVPKFIIWNKDTTGDATQFWFWYNTRKLSFYCANDVGGQQVSFFTLDGSNERVRLDSPIVNNGSTASIGTQYSRWERIYHEQPVCQAWRSSTVPITSAGGYTDITPQDADIKGSHDGGDGEPSMTDSNARFPESALIGKTIQNTTDGSSGTITENSSTTIIATLSGGTDNDWDDGDSYVIVDGSSIGITLSSDKIIFSKNGWYLLNFMIEYGGATSSDDIKFRIYYNDYTTAYGGEWVLQDTSAKKVLALSYLFYAEDTDYIRLQGWIGGTGQQVDIFNVNASVALVRDEP